MPGKVLAAGLLVCLATGTAAMVAAPQPAGLVRGDPASLNTTVTEKASLGELQATSSVSGISLWLPLSSILSSSWNLVQGRGKKGDKGQGMAMMMGGMMLMMALSALAALSGKALAASLAALMLAAMSLMKKGGGGGGHHHSTYEVVALPHGDHYHRSLLPTQDAEPASQPTVASYAPSAYDISVESLPMTKPYQTPGPNHRINRRSLRP